MSDQLSDEERKMIFDEEMKKLNELIDKEIQERKGEVQFIPSEYRKHRLAGKKPEEIHYDLCHPWR
ncbi:MAG TPA: hypothetical protein VLH94_04010 [Spirochaetia bacterium]|nr:hypothetical protein [Spirochaetia bacterium]